MVYYFKKIDIFTIFMLDARFSKPTFRALRKDVAGGVKAKADTVYNQGLF